MSVSTNAQYFSCCNQCFLTKEGFAKHKLEKHSQIISFGNSPSISMRRMNSGAGAMKMDIVPSKSMTISVRTIDHQQQRQAPPLPPLHPQPGTSAGLYPPRGNGNYNGIGNSNGDIGMGESRQDDMEYQDYDDEDNDNDFYANAITQCKAELKESDEILKFEDESDQDASNSMNSIKPDTEDCTGYGYCIGDRQFRCNSCYKVATSVAILKLHYESMHHPKNNKRCGLCGINVKHRCNFTRHLRTCHIPDGISCPFCTCTFATQLGLNSHVVKIHTVEDQRRYLNIRPLTKSSFRRLSKEDKQKRSCEYETQQLTEDNGSEHDNSQQDFEEKEENNSQEEMNDDPTLYGNLQSEIVRTVGGKFYECKLCGKLMKSRINLRQHMLIHSGEKPLSCDLCGIRFRFECNRRRHMRTCHVIDGEFKCLLCSCSFVSPVGLKVHISKYHNSSVPAKGNNNMFVVRKPTITSLPKSVLMNAKKTTLMNFATPKAIVSSNGTNGEDDIYKCNECGKLLNSGLNLRNHMLIHTGEKPETCDLCGQTFRLHSTLWGHKKVSHVKNGAYPCKQCPCVFDVERGLIRHRVIYHNFKSTEYHRRGRRARGKGTASRTLQLKLQPLYLGHVQLKSYNSIALAKPQKSKLSIKPKGKSGKRKPKCEVCNKTFRKEGHLTNHMRIHTGEKPEKCNYCGATFRLYSTLHAHIKSNHMGAGHIQCAYCSCTVKSKTAINMHYTKFHPDQENPLKIVELEQSETGVC